MTEEHRARLRDVCSRVSVGALCPSMCVEVVDRLGVALDGASVSEAAILITMDVVDSVTQAFRLALTQTFAPPEAALASDEACAEWILGRMEVVLVHELREFFRLDDRVLRPPAHPLPED